MLLFTLRLFTLADFPEQIFDEKRHDPRFVGTAPRRQGGLPRPTLPAHKEAGVEALDGKVEDGSHGLLVHVLVRVPCWMEMLETEGRNGSSGDVIVVKGGGGGWEGVEIEKSV